MTKICKKCYLELDINRFNVNNAKKDKINIYCKECEKPYKKEFYKKHKDIFINRTLEWKKNNAERWKTRVRIYNKKYRKTEKGKLSSRSRELIKNKIKNPTNCFSSTIGCTSLFLKDYLKLKFRENMSWQNYGIIWNIDHIIPLSAFIKEERKYINHYLNLQPLFIKENESKGKSYKEEDKQELINKINNLPPHPMAKDYSMTKNQ